MQIVVLTPRESPRPAERAEPPLADVIREAMNRLDGAEHRWVMDEKGLAAELARGVDVLVVAAATVDERQIRRVRVLRPPPIVVVTLDPSATALALRRIAVEEIVGPQPEAVALAIERQADTAVLVRVTRVVEGHPRLSPITRRWMLLTLRARPPYAYVSTAAKDLHISRATVGAHWGEDVGGSSPKEWLERIQLACAIQCRRGTTSWTKVAGQLQISVRTLERLGPRRVECRLSQIASDPDRALSAIEEYFAMILAGD